MTGEPTLADVRAMFPDWHVWKGVSGLVYARWLMSSPPAVVRAEDPRDLIDGIAAEILKRESR
jgi:hypothetical protein